MSNMTLRDGVFWKDGKVVPIEIGNAEQIEILKKLKKRNEELINGEFELSLDVEREVKWEGKFDCLCTNPIFIEISTTFYNDLEDVLTSEEYTCKKCGRIYEVSHDYDDDVLIELISHEGE